MTKIEPKVLKVAAASLNQLPMDWSGNFNNIEAALKYALKEGVELVCFPELCIPGYGCEDMFLAEFVWSRSLEQLKTLIPLTKNIVCTVGLPLRFQEKLFNSIAVISNGELLGFACKHVLAKEEVISKSLKVSLSPCARSFPFCAIILEPS